MSFTDHGDISRSAGPGSDVGGVKVLMTAGIALRPATMMLQDGLRDSFGFGMSIPLIKHDRPLWVRPVAVIDWHDFAVSACGHGYMGLRKEGFDEYIVAL